MMNQQIIINTDETGLTLYNLNIENGPKEINHLNRLNSYNELFEQLKKAKPEFADKKDLAAFKNLIDLGALLSIARLDIQIIASQLHLSKQKFQQLFYSKHAYLVIYETFINLKSKQKFIKSYSLGASEEITNQYDNAFKNWSKFTNDYKVQTDIKNIRNNIVGHIEKEFSVWHKTAFSLDPVYTTQIIIAFINSLNGLQSLTTMLVRHYNTKILK